MLRANMIILNKTGMIIKTPFIHEVKQVIIQNVECTAKKQF